MGNQTSYGDLNFDLNEEHLEESDHANSDSGYGEHSPLEESHMQLMKPKKHAHFEFEPEKSINQIHNTSTPNTDFKPIPFTASTPRKIIKKPNTSSDWHNTYIEPVSSPLTDPAFHEILKYSSQSYENRRNDMQGVYVRERRLSLIKSISTDIEAMNDDDPIHAHHNNSSCDECRSHPEEINSMPDSVFNDSNVISNSWSPNSVLHSRKISTKTSGSKESTPTQASVSELSKKEPSSSYPLLSASMNLLGSLRTTVGNLYNSINPATLTGAIDVVVVQQEDGSLRCSPFHVRFGKMVLISSKETIVDIKINGELVPGLHMELGSTGAAYFLEKIERESLTSGSDLRRASSSSSCDDEECVNNQHKTSGASATFEIDEELTKSTLSTSKSAIMMIEKKDPTTSAVQELPTLSMSAPTESNLNMGLLGCSPNINMNENDIRMRAPMQMNFSEGDITPEHHHSRPQSPKSDTELDLIERRNSGSNTSAHWNWNYGEPEPTLQTDRKNSQATIENPPSSSVLLTIDTPIVTQKSQPESSPRKEPRSLSSLMKNLLSTEKKTDGDIYLEDLEDTEVAAVYLGTKNPANTKFKANLDDDVESGTGQSLPQSPFRHSDYHAILGEVQISLCGLTAPTTPHTMSTNSSITCSSLQLNLNTPVSSPESDPNLLGNQQMINFEEHFQQHLVPLDKFMENIATITANPNLVVKVNGRYMNWSSASSIILAALCFQKTLSHETVNTIIDKNMPKVTKDEVKKELEVGVAPVPTAPSGNWFWNRPKKQPVETQASDKSVDEVKLALEKGLDKAKHESKDFADQNAQAVQLLEELLHSSNVDETVASQSTEEANNRTILVAPVESNEQKVDELAENESLDLLIESAGDEAKRGFLTRSKSSTNSRELGVVESENYYQQPMHELKSKHVCHRHRQQHDSVSLNSCSHLKEKVKQDKFRKTTRLSSDLIKRLNLKMGANEIQYSVTTALQGTARIASYIFLWNYDDRIIISDIDGTITKSDVLGQVLPIFGRDWSHAGVAKLYTAIERNQYKFMYLSARAIGQSKITRDLLRDINHDGIKLPEGPLLVTPSSLYTAFRKEVIEKVPEEFKIQCLKDIQSLFPDNRHPFYAGYGNKTSDVKSYKTVGIPIARIFTINPAGELKHEVSSSFQSSYSQLCDFVDIMFPVLCSSTASHVKRDFDSFNYWRDTFQPIMDVEREMQESLAKEALLALQKSSPKSPKTPKSSQSSPPATSSKTSSLTKLEPITTPVTAIIISDASVALKLETAKGASPNEA